MLGSEWPSAAPIGQTEWPVMAQTDGAHGYLWPVCSIHSPPGRDKANCTVSRELAGRELANCTAIWSQIDPGGRLTVTLIEWRSPTRQIGDGFRVRSPVPSNATRRRRCTPIDPAIVGIDSGPATLRSPQPDTALVLKSRLSEPGYR